jgi:GntR family transcriptional regulator, transcriptional repressor for pyruvate dehydrogenase complex
VLETGRGTRRGPTTSDSELDYPLTPQTASESAARFLRAMIFSGELGPGDRLPPERDLSARLGISRITLRLALKSLESTGYIVTTRGAQGGSRVTDEHSLFRCWLQWMLLHSEELDDVFELRLAVEPKIAALAAIRRTDDELHAMERAVKREAETADSSSIFRADMDIHKAIARASHSRRLQQAMLEARAELFMPVDQAAKEGKQEAIHLSHATILAAIRTQDADAAADLMHEHILNTRDLIRHALEGTRLAGAGTRRG